MSGDTLLNGRYRLVAQQGSGGMAVIYKAVDQSLGRTVAVKVLRPSLTAEPTFITRFQNEARSIANLTHPNIVTVHDVGNDGPTNYIVMEFVEGRDLKKIIREQGSFSLERSVNLGIMICAGLGFAHRAGIVHADVKPQNILINRDDIVKITDFGIAQALSDTQPTQRQSVVWGSPHYFAPEQAQGEKPTAGSDVYSIGIVMFEMLTGKLPYTGSNQQELALAHIREPIPLAHEINPAIPEELSHIIAKTMNKDPTDRYRMADQLGHILISYRDRGVSPTSVLPPSEEMPLQEPERSSGDPVHGYVRPSKPSPQGSPLGQHGKLTQRYNVVPDAPVPPPYSQPPQAATDHVQQVPYAPPAQMSGDSRRFPYNQTIRDEPVQEGLDSVTIALAFLAFMSVACLIPLYLVVLQARLG